MLLLWQDTLTIEKGKSSVHHSAGWKIDYIQF